MCILEILSKFPKPFQTNPNPPFHTGELTLLPKNVNKLDQQIASLERLNDNVYKRKYDDIRVASLKSASLMTNEQIKLVLSTAYIEENKEMQKLTNRIKSSISQYRYSSSEISKSKQKTQETAKK